MVMATINDDPEAISSPEPAEEAISTLEPAEEAISTPVPAEPFPFLNLPPELRNQIYTYILLLTPETNPELTTDTQTWFSPVPPEYQSQNFIVDAIVNVPGSNLDDYGTNQRPLTNRGAILRTNRQIYHEALPIAYGKNSFQLCGTSPLAAFLALIGPVARANIPEIFLCWCNIGRGVEAFKLMKSCERLKQLIIRVSETCEEDVVKGEGVSRFRDSETARELSKLRGLRYLGWTNDSENEMFEDEGAEDWLCDEVMKEGDEDEGESDEDEGEDE
ncbi:MAG: hypothetical protein M1812_007402 [Candelaria pacifica]|nr:MAG: hypothetical protein M1812_007402 [Candelaria pacifica]